MNSTTIVRILLLYSIRKSELKMNTKLTLKLNKKVIDKAKRYARKNNQSLSALVESYFNLISENENSDEIEISPNVVELSGVIKLPEDVDIKKIYKEHLEEKYSQ